MLMLFIKFTYHKFNLVVASFCNVLINEVIKNDCRRGFYDKAPLISTMKSGDSFLGTSL